MGFFGGFIVPGTGHYHAWYPPSASVDLKGGAVQPYADELVETFLCGGRNKLLGGGVDGHVRHPCLALAHLVASQTPTHACLEEIAEHLRPVLVAEPHQRPGSSGVGLVLSTTDHGGARREGGMEELLLPPVLVAVVREEVLADVLVGAREPLVKEGALPRSLQAYEDY